MWLQVRVIATSFHFLLLPRSVKWNYLWRELHRFPYCFKAPTTSGHEFNHDVTNTSKAHGFYSANHILSSMWAAYGPCMNLWTHFLSSAPALKSTEHASGCSIIYCLYTKLFPQLAVDFLRFTACYCSTFWMVWADLWKRIIRDFAANPPVATPTPFSSHNMLFFGSDYRPEIT